jgi:hypothetical protein
MSNYVGHILFFNIAYETISLAAFYNQHIFVPFAQSLIFSFQLPEKIFQ